MSQVIVRLNIQHTVFTHGNANRAFSESCQLSTHCCVSLSAISGCCLLSCRHAKQKAQQGEVADAAAVLAEYGASSEAANFELYEHIVGGVLALSHAEQSRQGELSCKDFLWQLVQPVLSTAGGTDLPAKVTGNSLCLALTLLTGPLPPLLDSQA